jgi:hypothetical protein
LGGGEGGEEGKELHVQEGDEGSGQEDLSAVCLRRVLMTAESYRANAASFSSTYLKVNEFQGKYHYLAHTTSATGTHQHGLLVGAGLYSAVAQAASPRLQQYFASSCEQRTRVRTRRKRRWRAEAECMSPVLEYFAPAQTVSELLAAARELGEAALHRQQGREHSA